MNIDLNHSSIFFDKNDYWSDKILKFKQPEDSLSEQAKKYISYQLKIVFPPLWNRGKQVLIPMKILVHSLVN